MPVIQPYQYEKFTAFEFLARQVVEGFITGLHKSPYHGFSVEFAEHRLYNTGESTRHIDWKLFARSDKLFTKRYEEETNLRCRLVIDISPSMFFPVENLADNNNKLAFSLHCAAALTELLRRQRDAVGLSLFSNRVRFHSQCKSSYAHIKMIYHELEKAYLTFTPGMTGSTHIAPALHQIAEDSNRRSLVVLFTDMFDAAHPADEIFAALQHMRFCKHEVLLFHVTDSQHEINLDYENRPYTFVDIESGEEIKLNPVQVKQQYRLLMQQKIQQLKQTCAQYAINLIECDMRAGYDAVLTQYLVKRSRLY